LGITRELWWCYYWRYGLDGGKRRREAMKGKDVGGTSLMTNEDHGGVDNIGGKIS
jgi:hypothetical protein